MTAPADALPPDRVRAILDERARRLAAPVVTAGSSDVGVGAVLFTVSRQRYAVASRYVHAVFQLVELVPLPGARSPVVGLTRWRGDVLTVLDLRRLVGLSVHALDDLGRVIVIGDAAAELGILADALDELRAVDPATLFPLSDRTADRAPDSAALVAGVTVDGVHMIDAAVLLARQREPVPSSAAGASSLAPLPPSTTAER